MKLQLSVLALPWKTPNQSCPCLQQIAKLFLCHYRKSVRLQATPHMPRQWTMSWQVFQTCGEAFSSWHSSSVRDMQNKKNGTWHCESLLELAMAGFTKKYIDQLSCCAFKCANTFSRQAFGKAMSVPISCTDSSSCSEICKRFVISHWPLSSYACMTVQYAYKLTASMKRCRFLNTLESFGWAATNQNMFLF